MQSDWFTSDSFLQVVMNNLGVTALLLKEKVLGCVLCTCIYCVGNAPVVLLLWSV